MRARAAQPATPAQVIRKQPAPGLLGCRSDRGAGEVSPAAAVTVSRGHLAAVMRGLG
jgi:hypothetical protein